MSWRCMDAISLTQHSFALRRANQTVNGEPVASKGCTAGSERGMGKHAGRKAGRCALSLLYEGGRWKSAEYSKNTR
jgi:hypothetical protein